MKEVPLRTEMATTGLFSNQEHTVSTAQKSQVLGIDYKCNQLEKCTLGPSMKPSKF